MTVAVRTLSHWLGLLFTRFKRRSRPVLAADMPTATATAKPVLPPLQTPKSATFPSELHSCSLPSLIGVIKQEDDLKTPITPPVAYTDFLKALTPVLASPMTTGVSFNSTTSDKSSSGKTTPTSQPSTANSSCFCICEGRKSPNNVVAPSSTFARPKSGRVTSPNSLRRLRIPQSPLYSPATESPLSVRSPFSPADWVLDGGVRYFEAPRSACARPVSVRQVVTRTVTYKRTPLDPAPKGKRKRSNDA